jgi:hypothetical protein
VNSKDLWTWICTQVSTLCPESIQTKTYLDEELAYGVKDGNRKRREESSDDGDDDPRVVSDPVPDVMRFHPLFKGQPEPGRVLAAFLLEDKAVHAVPGHDRVPDQDKVDVGKLGQHLGVGRLRGNVGNLSIAAEQAVQGLL